MSAVLQLDLVVSASRPVRFNFIFLLSPDETHVRRRRKTRAQCRSFVPGRRRGARRFLRKPISRLCVEDRRLSWRGIALSRVAWDWRLANEMGDGYGWQEVRGKRFARRRHVTRGLPFAFAPTCHVDVDIANYCFQNSSCDLFPPRRPELYISGTLLPESPSFRRERAVICEAKTGRDIKSYFEAANCAEALRFSTPQITRRVLCVRLENATRGRYIKID